MKVPSNLVKDIRNYYCEQLCSIYDKDESNAMILILFEHYFNIDRVKMALEPQLRLSESEMLTFHFAVKDLLKNKLDNVEFICCNGLKAYGNKSIDQCIISGMGGDEIIDIITSSPIQIDSFILSPQHNILNVKKFMLEKGYNINYDLIISDKNKFYNIFRCEKSDSPKNLSNFQLIIGDTNFIDTNRAAEEFVEYEIRKINNILSTHKVDNSAMLEYLELLKEFYKRKEIYEKNVRVSKTRYGNK